MSESRTQSTLELVVNDQQVRNMSQIDLSSASSNNATDRNNYIDPAQETSEQTNGLFNRLQMWPSQLRQAMSSKLANVREKSDSNIDFGIRLAQEFATIFAWFYCFLSTVLMPIVFIIIGLINLGQCAASTALPYVVFAIGFVMTTSNLFNLGLACDLPILRNQEFLSDDLKNIIASIVNVLLNCIAAFLFIICGHLVFTLDFSNYPDTSSACNTILYDSTYWYITITIVIVLALCLLALGSFAYNRYKLALIRGATETTTTNAS